MYANRLIGDKNDCSIKLHSYCLSYNFEIIILFQITKLDHRPTYVPTIMSDSSDIRNFVMGLLPDTVKEAINNATSPPNDGEMEAVEAANAPPPPLDPAPPPCPILESQDTTDNTSKEPCTPTCSPLKPITDQPTSTNNIELFGHDDSHGQLMHEEDEADVDLVIEEKDDEMDDSTTHHPAYNIIAAMKDFKVPKVDNFPINQKRRNMATTANVAVSSALKRSASSNQDTIASHTTTSNTSSPATSTVGTNSNTTCNQEAQKHIIGTPLVYDYTPFNGIFTINLGTNPKGYGAVKTGTTKESLVINMTSDCRGLSTACVGNMSQGFNMSECLKDLINTPHTASGLARDNVIICCCTPDRTHIFSMEKPIILVLVDKMVPPVLGGDGTCAIVIRVDKATPSTILTAAKNFFESSGPNSTSLPRHSVVLLSLTNYCLEVEACAYISEMEGLKRKLAKLLYTRSPANATYSSDPMMDQHIMNMCYTFIDIMVPHQKVSEAAAVAAATVALLATTAAGASGKQLAGDVAATYLDTMDDDTNGRRIKRMIPPVHISNDITGNSSNRAIITARQELTAYVGLSKGINIEQVVKFWARVFGRCRRFVTSRQIEEAENFPSERAILAGVFSKHNNESKLKETFPRIFEKFGCKKTASIHSRLGPRMEQPSTASKAESTEAVGGLLPPRPAKLVLPQDHPGHHVRGRIVLVGASNAANLLDILRQGFPNLQTKLISPRGMGSRISHYTISGIKKDIALEKLEKQDTIILFGFSNALMRNRLSSPINSSFSLKPLSITSNINSKTVNAFHTCISARFSSTIQPLFPISDSEATELCDLLEDLICHLEQNTPASILLLGPLPRFPLRCCNNTLHHGFKEPEVMELIRDLNAFVVSSDKLNSSRYGGRCLAIPFDIIVRRKLTNPYDGALIVKADNVHVHEWVLKELASLIVAIIAKSSMQEIGLAGDHAVVTRLDFKSWRPALINTPNISTVSPIINTTRTLSFSNISFGTSDSPQK